MVSSAHLPLFPRVVVVVVAPVELYVSIVGINAPAVVHLRLLIPIQLCKSVHDASQESIRELSTELQLAIILTIVALVEVMAVGIDDDLEDRAARRQMTKCVDHRFMSWRRGTARDIRSTMLCSRASVNFAHNVR